MFDGKTIGQKSREKTFPVICTHVHTVCMYANVKSCIVMFKCINMKKINMDVDKDPDMDTDTDTHMDMDVRAYIGTSMFHGHGHLAWTWTWIINILHFLFSVINYCIWLSNETCSFPDHNVYCRQKLAVMVLFFI